MKKLLSIAFVAGAVCVSCSSNEMESLANDLQTAVDKKEKVKILDLAKEYNLEKAKKQSVYFASSNLIDEDLMKEIKESVKERMSEKYDFLLSDYESSVDNAVKYLVKVHKGDNGAITKTLDAFLEVKNVQEEIEFVKQYFTENQITEFSKTSKIFSLSKEMYAVAHLRTMLKAEGNDKYKILLNEELLDFLDFSEDSFSKGTSSWENDSYDEDDDDNEDW